MPGTYVASLHVSEGEYRSCNMLQVSTYKTTFCGITMSNPNEEHNIDGPTKKTDVEGESYYSITKAAIAATHAHAFKDS